MHEEKATDEKLTAVAESAEKEPEKRDGLLARVQLQLRTTDERKPRPLTCAEAIIRALGDQGAADVPKIQFAAYHQGSRYCIMGELLFVAFAGAIEVEKSRGHGVDELA